MMMADEPQEDEVLELTDIAEDEPETDDADEGDASDEEGDEETVVSFGDDDTDQEQDSAVIRKLRERNRDLNKQLSDARKAVPEAPTIEVGPKPTLIDFDYDEDAYVAAVDEWRDRKAQAEAGKAEAEEQSRKLSEDWQRDVQSYAERKTALAIPDYDEAEGNVQTALSLAQQAVIIKAAADPALFVAAIGKSEAKLGELAKISDPIKMAAAVARMEGGIKVVKKRSGPALDTPQKGGAPVADASDKNLAKLEKEARASGDYSKVLDYKRKLRERK